MSKSKTNALDALRALIAERQQYDQWISTLESKRDGTVEHVFNRVYSDYRSRLDRVVGEIRGHAEELQLSIAALSSRLGEVAKDEEAKRDAMAEAKLRADVGEYDDARWESMQADAKRELDKIAGDRASLEGQLAELESIKKLSEVTAPSIEAIRAESSPEPEQSSPVVAEPTTQPAPTPSTASVEAPPAQHTAQRKQFSDVGWPARDIVEPMVDVTTARQDATAVKSTARPADAPSPAPAARASVGTAASSAPASPQTFAANMDAALAVPRPSATPVAPPPTPTPPRKKRDTPTGKDAEISSGFSKPIRTPADSRPEVNKTLKCPECGTANYPTEWYCERCGGELATM
jgi:hypothetical protein